MKTFAVASSQVDSLQVVVFEGIERPERALEHIVAIRKMGEDDHPEFLVSRTKLASALGKSYHLSDGEIAAFLRTKAVCGSMPCSFILKRLTKRVKRDDGSVG